MNTIQLFLSIIIYKFIKFLIPAIYIYYHLIWIKRSFHSNGISIIKLLSFTLGLNSKLLDI